MDASTSTPEMLSGPIFSEADYERAIAALDLLLQNFDWAPDDNYLQYVCRSLHSRGITLALARALVRRLLDEKVFRYWERTIPAGSTWEGDVFVHRVEPERIECLITTRAAWYTFLNNRKQSVADRQALASQEESKLAKLEADATKPIKGSNVADLDGPEPPCWLRHGGRRHPIGQGRSRRLFDLLSYMWNREEATFQELQGPGRPWPDAVADSTISTTVNRLNAVLPRSLQRRLGIHNYCVIWRKSQ
jgi:hypothetical protein